MVRFNLRERDYMPGMNTPDQRPEKDIKPRPDLPSPVMGTIAVEMGKTGGVRMVVTVEELIRHAARKGGQKLLPDYTKKA